MSPFVKRLILSVIALPAVYALSAVLTGYHHLAMAIAVAAVMAGGSAETGALLLRAGLPASRIIVPVAAATIPFCAYLTGAGILPGEAELLWVGLLLAAVFVQPVLAGGKRPVTESLRAIGSHAVQLLYPAFFGSFIVSVAVLDGAASRYVLFFCLVFGNDISAYLAGRAAGPGTALGIKASPAKTAVGFATGFAAAVGFAALARGLFPQEFPYPWWAMCMVGGLTALATFAGDLAESALKRAAGVKDSGSIMLGRGGILDSVDSLVMSAPLYYLLFRALGS
jgi:phosphatidate cytidylyltransferase